VALFIIAKEKAGQIVLQLASGIMDCVCPHSLELPNRTRVNHSTCNGRMDPSNFFFL
jgi:hypothetical protein